MKKIILLSIFLVSSCMSPFDKGEVRLTFVGKASQAPKLTSVQLIGDQLIVNGENFTNLNSVKLNSTSLTVISNTGSKIILSAASAITLAMGSALNLVVDTAQGAAAIPVIFNIVDGSVTASKLSDMGASTGQFLKYNGTSWVPTTISSGLTYLGGYNASTNSPNATLGGYTNGEYYIVSTAGTQDLGYGNGSISWNVGDWLVWNGTDFDQINNTVGVTSVNGSSGVITKTDIFSGSVLNDIGDVDTTGIATGKILKWDGTKWAISDDLSSGGAGSVSSTEITDGTIVDADINAAAAIAQSKIAGLSTLATTVGSNTTALSGKVNTSTTVNGQALSSNVTLTTTNIAEGTNLYYTTARAKADAILNSTAGSETDQGASVAAMKSYVTTSVSTAVAGKVDTTTTVNGQALSSNVTLTTTNIAEGTNLYYTTARAKGDAVVNSTAGSETDQAASVAAMKSYVSAQTAGAGTGDLKADGSVSMTGNFDLGTKKIINGSGASLKGDASLTLTGTVEVSGTSLIGTGTAFTTELIVGDIIDVAGKVLKIATITDNTTATVSVGATIASGQTLIKLNSILAITKSDNSDALSVLSNGNVGIGTTTPATQLQVTNGAGFGVLMIGDNSATNNHHITHESSDQSFRIYDGIFGLGVTRFMINSSGNVGIATTTPSEKLEVNGNVKATSFIGDGSGLTNIATAVTGNINLNGDATKVVSMDRHTTSDTAGNSLTVNAGGATTGATDKSGGDLVLSSGTSTGTGTSKIEFKTSPASSSGTTDNTPTTAMTIIGNGNVGIGTTAPTRKLDVRGNIYVGDGLDKTPDAAGDGHVMINGLGYTGFLSLDANTMNIGHNSASRRIDFLTDETSRMTIAGNGNVGIGTTSPLGKLHVRPAAGEDFVVDGWNATDNIDIDALIPGTTSGSLISSPANAHMTFALKDNGGNDGFHFITTGGDYGTDNTYDVAAMSILGNGNVGIGTTSPSTQLQVVSDTNPSGGNIANFSGTYGSYSLQDVGLNFTSTITNASPHMKLVDADNSVSRPIIHAQGNGGTVEALYVGSDGSVGIGTSAPTRKLEVVDDSTLVTYPISLSNDFGTTTDLAGTGIIMGRPSHPWGAIVGNQQKVGDYNGGMLLLQTETSDASGLETKMVINNLGFVGIGTLTPSQPLHVSTTSNTPVVIESTDTIARIEVKDTTSSSAIVTNAGDLQFTTNGTAIGDTKLSITSVGNVGIGTTTPSEKLEVNGRVLASSLKLVWTNKTNANNGEVLTSSSNVFIDSTTAAFGLTLPAVPAHGDEIRFVHSGGDLTTNNVTITAGTGDTIVGDATLVLDLNNISIDLIFYDPNTDGNGDWRLR